MKVYITFGQVHVHSVNGKTFDKNCVAVINNVENENEGRKKAFEYFNDKWHNSYTEKTWKNSLLEYFPRGLIET